MEWSVPREWEGETAFIIGGGPSVATQDLDLIRDRRVIVINRSFETYPDADVLTFYDPNFYRHFREKIRQFRGRIVTCNAALKGDRILHLKRKQPPGLADDPRCATIKRTSFTLAINIAVHFGAIRIVLLGADGRVGANGKNHHHGSYPWWTVQSDRFEKHRAELSSLVEPLRSKGISVINASPGSAWNMWPVMSLKEAIA